MTSDNSIRLTKSTHACCTICNPAGLVDYEGVGVRVERLGETLEVCFVCIEALRALLHFERVQTAELTMRADCADLARRMMALGVRL